MFEHPMPGGSFPVIRHIGNWEQRPDSSPYVEFADVAIGSGDLVFGLTREPGEVLVFESDGTFVRRFGAGVLGSRPHGVTVAADGRVLVVDEPNHAIRIFDAEGHLAGTMGTPGTASDTGADNSLGGPALARIIRRAAGPFHNPTKVAFALDGSFYVSDGYGNARVHRYDPDGALMGSWGEPGYGDGQFLLVHCVAVLRDGRILVVDRENDRLQAFTADGRHLATWAVVQRPASIAEDAGGRIYIGELPYSAGDTSTRFGLLVSALPAGVAVLDLDGRVVDRFTELYGSGGPQAVIAPHGLAMDSRGSLYIAETSHSATGSVHERTLQKLAATA
jgi:DNA-binding beta-propeller fold protein YncE